MIRGEEKRMQKEEERTARMNVLISIIFPETYPEHKTSTSDIMLRREGGGITWDGGCLPHIKKKTKK